MWPLGGQQEYFLGVGVREETNLKELFFCFLSNFTIRNKIVPLLSEMITKPLVCLAGAGEQNQ